MNIILINVSFENGTCEVSGINLITGDYNSTVCKFTFDKEDGTKVFKMKNPNDETVFEREIIDNEVVLTGYDENDEPASIFNSEGDYGFEVNLYDNDGRLTSSKGVISVEEELVKEDDKEIEVYKPLFDQLMAQLNTAINETNNLDIDAEKVDTTTTITITKKDGTQESVEILDGEKGDTGDDGQDGITPNIQVGNTTTLPAGSNATVTQRGTTENPIFDFGIPKGQDGSGGGTSDYASLTNKPKINDVELVGNKTTSDLGIVIPDISTKQDKITTTNKLSSDLVDDTNGTNKFVTASDKTTWNGKQDALVSGTNIKTINNTSLLGSGNITINEGLNAKIYYIDKNATTQQLANYFAQWLADYKNNINDIIYIYSSYSIGICDLVITYNEGNGTIKLRTSFINNNSDVINYGTRYKNYGFYAKEATITNDTITNQTGWYADNAGYVPQSYNFLSTTNTSEFNPTVNSYNPSTAKYAEKMVESVAPVYSSSSTYAVGDYVSYQGKLYVCSTVISTAESWTTGHWTETTAMSVIGNLETALSVLTTGNGV